MGHSRKRKYVINESDLKEWETADGITLKYLYEHENTTFGNLLSHVNEELKKSDKKYSRKGYSLRLEVLVNKGEITRVPFKQGHYLYSITPKGEKNLELISTIFRNFAKGLLRSDFFEEQKESKEEHVEAIVKRIGIYMLFSCIDGILQYTSPSKKHQDNISNMNSWINGINPGVEIVNYLGDVTLDFVNFDTYEDIFTPMFNHENRLNILKDFQEILKKKYPQEYEFLEYRKKELPRYIKDKNETKTQAYKIKIRKILKDVDN